MGKPSLRAGRAVVMALVGLACTMGPASAQQIARVVGPPADLKRLPDRVVGRVQPQPDGGVLRQWPGGYFETRFDGASAYFKVGPGAVSLRISLDGGAAMPLVRPEPGVYLVAAPTPGPHSLRVDVASESQREPTGFGGFFTTGAAVAAPPPAKPRAIEFIGDSHTVGYGNTSTTRRCTTEEVWATTDTSVGVAPLTAARYGADYQVNAISGRGVVRNYNGGSAPTLPQAYPFILFDQASRAADAAWRPQAIVIALGTNDFSTPLNPGERWGTRDALHADFEATYVAFVQQLRATYPQAHIILWSTNFGDGEIRAEVAKVADRLRQAGDARVGFVPVDTLGFEACNFHPDLADDRKIADALAGYIDAHPEIWAAQP